MKFKDLKIGKKFKIVRDNDDVVYTKVNDNTHYNTTYDINIRISIHGGTIVKEIRK